MSNSDLIVVGIGEMQFSTDPSKILATYSLGSCLGVTAYDPKAKIGGLIHCLLPRPEPGLTGARTNPYKFVSSGIPRMVRELILAGAVRNRLIFNAAGGAEMRGEEFFSTGKHNIEALNKCLSLNRVHLTGSELGGTIPRSVFLHLNDGHVVIKTKGVSHDIR